MECDISRCDLILLGEKTSNVASGIVYVCESEWLCMFVYRAEQGREEEAQEGRRTGSSMVCVCKKERERMKIRGGLLWSYAGLCCIGAVVFGKVWRTGVGEI